VNVSFVTCSMLFMLFDGIFQSAPHSHHKQTFPTKIARIQAIVYLHNTCIFPDIFYRASNKHKHTESSSNNTHNIKPSVNTSKKLSSEDEHAERSEQSASLRQVQGMCAAGAIPCARRRGVRRAQDGKTGRVSFCKVRDVQAASKRGQLRVRAHVRVFCVLGVQGQHRPRCDVARVPRGDLLDML